MYNFNFLQKSPTIAQTRGSILQKLGHFSISKSRDRIHDILCNEKLPFLKNVKIEWLIYAFMIYFHVNYIDFNSNSH